MEWLEEWCETRHCEVRLGRVKTKRVAPLWRVRLYKNGIAHALAEKHGDMIKHFPASGVTLAQLVWDTCNAYDDTMGFKYGRLPPRPEAP